MKNPFSPTFCVRKLHQSLIRSSAAVIAKKNTMSEAHLDNYDHYNFDHDKHIYSGHSGKQRTKKEASTHTNHNDPSGHSRKIVTKFRNSENNKKKH